MTATEEEETSRTQKEKKLKKYMDELKEKGMLSGYAEVVIRNLDNIQYKETSRNLPPPRVKPSPRTRFAPKAVRRSLNILLEVNWLDDDYVKDDKELLKLARKL